MMSIQLVKKRMADGSVREYSYDRNARRATSTPKDSVGALLVAFRSSPEWSTYAPTTRARYGSYATPLEAFKDVPAADVRRRHILDIRDRIAYRDGPAAANRFASVASVIFAWAVGREWIEHNPARGIKQLPGGALRAWTMAEYADAMPRLPEPIRRAVVLARWTGQRRGDLCALPWGAYDGATIRLTQIKTRVHLAIPVAPDLRSELDAWRPADATGPILRTCQGVPWVGEYMSTVLGEELAKMSPDLVGLNVHGLRKLCAADLAQRGCSTHEIAAITGHKTLSMVAHYTASVDQSRLAETAMMRYKTPM